MTHTTALAVVAGDVVHVYPAMSARFVGSTHYAGDVEGTGTVTLCFMDGTTWRGSSHAVVQVIGSLS